MAASGEEFGPYTVYEQLGLGGMATVHRAETQGIAGFRKTVALKRMLPSVAANDELVKSFIREARLASYLRHENVAQTYDLGKVGDTYFIAMELVTGRNLREILKHCASVCGPIPLPLALHVLNQVCDALDYAHNLCDDAGKPLGIIHRDVSPANVIVAETGVVKLIDFGIAKITNDGQQTVSRTIKGKFAYMAPEYIGGRIDARADLFALGIIAHELLANRPLFQGDDEMATLNNVRSMEIDPPSSWRHETPEEIDSIVMTALARDPNRRWQSAHALREALTTETKRLGLVAVNQQVVEWLERAFKSGPAPDSQPSIVISTGAPLGSDPLGLDIDSDVSAAETGLFVSKKHMMLDRSGRTEATRPGSPHVIRRGSPQGAALPRPALPGVAGRAPPPAPLMLPTSGPSPLAMPTLLGTDASPAGAPRLRVLQPVQRAQPDDATIGNSASELDVDSVASTAGTNVAAAKPRAFGVLYAFLVLAIAAATAAVVYFVLPYFT